MFPFKPLGVLRACHGKRLLLWDRAFLGEANGEPGKRGSELVWERWSSCDKWHSLLSCHWLEQRNTSPFLSGRPCACPASPEGLWAIAIGLWAWKQPKRLLAKVQRDMLVFFWWLILGVTEISSIWNISSPSVLE